MRHELKILPEYFQAVWDGKKKFEIRKNDRDFKVGDEIILKEWMPDRYTSGGKYTGSCLFGEITYILKDFEGLAEGYCAFSVEFTGGERKI